MRLYALFFLAACSTASTVDLAPDDDNDRYSTEEDCDDTNKAVFPGASEVCDGVDNDCDGDVDEGVTETQYADADGDNYGDAGAPVATCGETTAGVVHNDADCDDTDAAVNPMGDETLVLCDGLDNDCDGAADGGFRVPDDYPLPSQAVGAAQDGDTVCVAPGTYEDNIDFGGDDVWLYGYGGAEVTTVVGVADEGPVLSFDTRESPAAKVSGLTISGGDDATGAGVYIRGADPTLEDLVIADNSCDNAEGSCYGTGLYAEDSEFVGERLVIRGNVQRSTYTYYPYNYGAGMALVRSSPTLVDVTLTENTIEFPANAYYGAGAGAGLYVNGGDPDVTRLTATGNIIQYDGTTYGYGAGIYLYSTRGWYQNVVLADNEVRSMYAYGAGAMLGDYATPTFTNLVVANNTTGGAETISAYGGGMFIGYDAAYVENADIVGNTATATTGGGGGAMYAYYYSYPTFLNVSVWGNTSSIAGTQVGGAIMADPTNPPSSLTFEYCNLSQNGTSPYQGFVSPVGASGNLEGDPAYVDTSGEYGADWDLTLGRGSALTDAGDPTFEDADGSASDIGSRGGPGGDDW